MPESAEAIVVKKPVETREERRAEEPRESNQSPDFVRLGEKAFETKGRGNCGSYPEGSAGIGPWKGRRMGGWIPSRPDKRTGDDRRCLMK